MRWRTSQTVLLIGSRMPLDLSPNSPQSWSWSAWLCPKLSAMVAHGVSTAQSMQYAVCAGCLQLPRLHCPARQHQRKRWRDVGRTRWALHSPWLLEWSVHPRSSTRRRMAWLDLQPELTRQAWLDQGANEIDLASAEDGASVLLQCVAVCRHV